MRPRPFLLLIAGVVLVMLAVLYGGFLGSANGESDYEMDIKSISPTVQNAQPSATGDPCTKDWTVKVRNLGTETDAGVVDFSITVPDNSFTTLDCHGCPAAVLSHVMQQGKETVVAIKPISDSWGGNRDDSNGGDQTAYIDEDGIITWPSGTQDNTSAPGWDIYNPTKDSWNYTSGKPMEPSASNFIDSDAIHTVSVTIRVGFATWAPPGTYTIQADARSWTDYDSTFTEGDDDGLASMIIDPPDFIIGDYDYISHAIGQSDEGLGWSKTSGGDEYFHFHVEVLNDGTEAVGAFKVGLLHQDQSLTDVQVSVTGAEIQTGEYVYFKATAAELGMATGLGESVSDTYTFYLAVDTEDDITESNENNNRQAITITAVSNRTDGNLNNDGQLGNDMTLDNGGSYDCNSELNNYDFESSDDSPPDSYVTGSFLMEEDSQGTEYVTVVKINPQVSVNSIHWFVLDADDDICAEGRTTDIYGLFLDEHWNITFVDNDFNGMLSPGDKYKIRGFDGGHTLRLWYGPPPLSQSAVIDFITPLSAEVGTVISFQGSVVSPDNNATYHYIWESSIDGELSDEASFNTSNLSVGFHLITLLIYDSNSSWNDTVTEWLIIYTRPIAIAGGDIKIKAGDMVQFLGQASDKDGNITLYEWDFDGNGIYDWSSDVTGLTEFRYSSEGTYNAVLRVTDNDGFTSTDSIVITVKAETDDGGDDDGGGIPAPSLAASVAAVAVIALRCQRKP
jgi:hypothetical protein